MNLKLQLGATLAIALSASAASAHLPFQKISATAGALTGPLGADDRFGISVAGLGDLDGDTVPDVIVGASQDDTGGSNRGAVYVLFMNTDGTVKAEQKIASGTGGFAGILANGVQFGASVANVGDLDNDGVTDVIVGAPLTPGGGTGRGGVWLLFLNTNGTVKAHQRIAEGFGGLSAVLDDNDQFGISVAGIGDLDNDGAEDVVVGAHLDDDGGTNRGCVRILALNTNGTVKATIKISGTVGGLGGVLADNDRFGVSVAGLGDFNGDTFEDIAVGANLDNSGGNDRGAVYILFLNATATVSSSTKFGSGVGGFTGVLDDSDSFGTSVANLGDLDGDGVLDLGVGALLDDDGGTDRGALWLCFLNSSGNVVANTKVSDTEGLFFGNLSDQDGFGRAVANVGDLNGNGFLEIFVGASGDDDGASEAGAVWGLQPDCFAPSSPSISYNGANVNPATYVEVTNPIINADWTTTVDIATPSALASIIQIGTGGPTSGFMLSGTVKGELLILPDFPPGLQDISFTGTHVIPIAEDCTLVGQTLFSQAATFKPGCIQLQNALQSTFGTF